MAANPKHVHEQAQVPVAEAPARRAVEPADASRSSSQESPARALQAQLQAELHARDVPLSRPQIIAMFVVFNLAAWWALYLVVAQLA